jgi:hypothetical protein
MAEVTCPECGWTLVRKKWYMGYKIAFYCLQCVEVKRLGVVK